MLRNESTKVLVLIRTEFHLKVAIILCIIVWTGYSWQECSAFTCNCSRLRSAGIRYRWGSPRRMIFGFSDWPIGVDGIEFIGPNVLISSSHYIMLSTVAMKRWMSCTEPRCLPQTSLESIRPKRHTQERQNLFGIHSNNARAEYFGFDNIPDPLPFENGKRAPGGFQSLPAGGLSLVSGVGPKWFLASNPRWKCCHHRIGCVEMVILWIIASDIFGWMTSGEAEHSVQPWHGRSLKDEVIPSANRWMSWSNERHRHASLYTAKRMERLW